MSRLGHTVSLTLVILGASPLVASASDLLHVHYSGCGHSQQPLTSPNQAPELDPSTAASALALLAGGVLLLRDRRRSFAR